MALPTEQAAPIAVSGSEALDHAITLRTAGLAAPFRWLRQGAQDVRRAWGIALFYGTCFWLMALLLAWVFRSHPQYTMSLASGCVLVGPFLAMGLYDTSRRIELGSGPDLGQSITCWDQQLPSMGMLVLVLIVLELLWGRASLVVFAVFFHTGMPSTAGVLQAVFSPENWMFVAVYTVVGGVFAAIAFASMVVSLPMMLDRGTDALTACITSFRVVLSQPVTMLLWGGIIAALVGAALLLPGQCGLLLVGPWLGCASWHAYRDCVVPPGHSAQAPQGKAPIHVDQGAAP